MVERNRMKIEKEVIGKIQKDYLFLVGKVKINAEYFIDKIKTQKTKKIMLIL